MNSSTDPRHDLFLILKLVSKLTSLTSLVSFVGDVLFFLRVNLNCSSSVMLAKPPGGFRGDEVADGVVDSGDVLVAVCPRGAPLDGEGAGLLPATFPATSGPLLSTVVTFLRVFPFWIWPRSALRISPPPLLGAGGTNFLAGAIIGGGGGGGPGISVDFLFTSGSARILIRNALEMSIRAIIIANDSLQTTHFGG